MSDLTQGQIAECQQIGGAIAKEVLKEHIRSCPHHQAYLVSKARFVGLLIGIIVASGVSSGTVVMIVLQTMKAFA